MSIIPIPTITAKGLLAAATLAVVLAEPGGCQSQSGGNSGGGQPDPTPKSCGTQPRRPLAITFQDKRAIEAVAVSVCDAPPIQHNVQVFLEKLISGQWVVQPGADGQPAGNCLDIPGAGAPRRCRWIITQCTGGRYRTRVTVFGYGPPIPGYPGGKPFNFPKKGDPPVVSDEVNIKC